MSRLPLLLLLLLPALAWSLPACLMLRFVDDAMDDTSTGGESSSTTVEATGSSVCTACDEVSAACEARQTCQVVRAIDQSCPDESFFTCLNAGACAALTPEEAAEGLSLWSEVVACIRDRCVGAEDRCSAESAACGAEPECVAMRACTRQECTCVSGDEGLACINLCAQAHPEGKDAWLDLLGCLDDKGGAVRRALVRSTSDAS